LPFFDAKRFIPVEELKAQMDRHIAAARQMQPFPGMDRAELPGGLEWQWERENREKGILVGDEHRQMLESAAEETGVVSQGERLRLCDFASAGEGGSPYVSWLKVKNVKATRYSPANPLRSGRVN